MEELYKNICKENGINSPKELNNLLMGLKNVVIEYKRFFIVPNVGIEDTLTGQIFTNNREITKALNACDTRANKNAELYYDLKFKKEDY